MCPEIIEKFSHGTNCIYLDVKCPCRHINVYLCTLLCCFNGAISEMARWG